MAWQSKINQWTQHLGGKTFQMIAGLGFATGIVVSMIPQTLGLNQYRKLTASYKDLSTEIPVDPNTLVLVDKCLKRIQLAPEEEANIDFFTTINHDILHKGSVKLKFGSIIGIPVTFSYRTVDEINTTSFTISERTIDWSTDVGKKLSEAIVLSDRAKAFAIARELKYCSSFHLNVDTLLRCTFGALAYSTGFILNSRLGLRERLKMWGRGGVYAVVGGAWLLVYLACSDAYSCFSDNRVDRAVASLTAAYAEGGVEYYNKILTRNQCLRALMGPTEGPRKYTLYGNNVTTWRRDHAPLTSRRDNLVRLANEYKQNIDRDNNNNSSLNVSPITSAPGTPGIDNVKQ